MSADAPFRDPAKKESIVARILPVFAGLVLFGVGCSPQASFQPETLEIGQDKLIVKGWTQGERFCVEIRLDSRQRALGLHSVNLVAPDGMVTVEVGHSWRKSFSNTPFESKPKVTVDKPNIASVSWEGEESGTLVITGVAEGEAVVTVKGKVRVAGLGAGGGLTVRDVSGTIRVKVTATGEYSRIVVMHVGQKVSVKFPKGMRLEAQTPNNSNPSVVFVRRNSSKQITLRGKKKGESWLTFKLFVKQKDGKEKEVPGTIWVIVKAGKPPRKEKHIKIGWDALPTGIITMDGRISLWAPSGGNYGNIGNACYVNYGGDEGTCGVEDGSWVRCNDDRYQDGIVVTDVPTYGEDPPSGCSSLDKEFPLPSETIVVVKDVPGACTVLAKPPPPAGDVTLCTLEPPDEDSETLVNVVDQVSQIDFTKKPLTGMLPQQAKATACQAAVWKVGSHIDPIKGNEVTNEDLRDHFFNTYLTATATTREKMTPEKREEMDTIVRDDLTTVIESVDFATKKHITDVPAGPPGELPDTVVEISDTPATKTATLKTCARKQKPKRRLRRSQARRFTRAEKKRLKELVSEMPNFLYNMDMDFLRVDKWALDPENPGGYQAGGSIVLTDKFFTMTKAQQKSALKHELGHQWHEENLKLVQDFLKIGWNVKDGKSYAYDDLKTTGALSSDDRSPSRKEGGSFPRRPGDKTDPPYSATNPLEDFGVSLELYLDDPASLKAQSPKRYNWMKNNIPKDAPAPGGR